MKHKAVVWRRTAVAVSVRDLVTIAQKGEKSNISYLHQEKSGHEADMIRGMKRRVTLKVKKVVLHGGIKNMLRCPID
jgi:hypothetical protein